LGLKVTLDTVKGVLMGSVAVVLVVVSIYFFIISLNLATAAQPNITASLLAALIGFSLLSAGVTVLKSWALSRAAEKLSK